MNKAERDVLIDFLLGSVDAPEKVLSEEDIINPPPEKKQSPELEEDLSDILYGLQADLNELKGLLGSSSAADDEWDPDSKDLTATTDDDTYYDYSEALDVADDDPDPIE